MNKFLLSALGLMAALSVCAQGTFDASNNYPIPGQPDPLKKAFILDPNGLPLAKAVGKVQILNAVNQETLSPGGTAGISLLADGLFFSNGIVVPGVATGGSVNLVIRAWDSSTGATWDTATSKISGLVTVNSLGGGTTPAAKFAVNSNFVGLQLPVIPEPSTIALATLGVAGLFFVARRKS